MEVFDVVASAAARSSGERGSVRRWAPGLKVMVYGGLDASHRPGGMTGHDQWRQPYAAGHGERAKGRGLWGVPVGLHDFGASKGHGLWGDNRHQRKVMVYGAGRQRDLKGHGLWGGGKVVVCGDYLKVILDDLRT